ncbi:MAG: type II toxin-antitoxin system PemK/MazF family toxin [Acutalibacteraceae bacterium]|nr:type II toxin-antitoxin system PemK/MazF family toxin [Acutalibacteraceae bacterium]
MMNYTHTNEIHRGNVYIVDLGSVEDRENSLFAKKRMGICISNEKCNKHSPILSFVFLSGNTSQAKLKLPTRVFVSAVETGRKDSTVACEQIVSIPRDNIIRYVTKLSDDTMKKIDNAVKIQLSL